MTRRTIVNITLVVFSAGLAAFLVEAALRLIAADTYYVWSPDTNNIFQPMPDVMPGITGESRFSINSDGIRGDPFPDKQSYRILTIGGSTTECLYLDDTEAWPYLLQLKMNEKLGNKSIWVGNIGKSGHDSRHHVLQVENLLPQYPKIDAVVMLIGINDLMHRLLVGEKYDPMSLAQKAHRRRLTHYAFSEIDRRHASGPFYMRTELWKRLVQVKNRFIDQPVNKAYVQDNAGDVIFAWRLHRKSAAHILDTLPSLTRALDAYSQNLNLIVDLTQQNDTRLIFVTQPALWKPDLSEELDNLLWGGGIGNFQLEMGKDYYSAAALASGLDSYNQTLLSICRKRDVECIDLASMLPKDTTVFYDDSHFNEAGAGEVAEVLADYLLSHTPSLN